MIEEVMGFASLFWRAFERSTSTFEELLFPPSILEEPDGLSNSEVPPRQTCAPERQTVVNTWHPLTVSVCI
jgi:hypothetical protein